MKKDFLEVAQARKSVRTFLPDPVPRDLIEEILEVAVMAPTNCNQQLWNFIVIDDPAVKERIVAKAAGNTIFRRAPALIALTYDGWNYKEAMQGASLALGHLLLAATYYGVSASPINSYGSDTKVKQALNIPDHEIICCFVTLGFPDQAAQSAPPVPRKQAQDVTHWNGFESKTRAPFVYNPQAWSLAELQLHQRHYCRKTFLGKEMDLAGKHERVLVRRVLQNKSGPFLDLVSYDGSYLRDFPPGELTTLDIAPEVAEYTATAAKVQSRELVSTEVYQEESATLPGTPQTITLIYKAERLSNTVLQKLFSQAYATLPKGGELVIISRRRFSLFSAFLWLLRIMFGEDVRHTGIYAFFGPYWPIQVGQVIKIAYRAGFRDVNWNGFFAFPSFFEQLYQMMVQFIRSGGSSYLHRDRRNDWISRTIERVLSWQGFKHCGWLGSVAVIACKK